jgi:cyclohexyl-isocyanide hydratase
MMLPD